MDFDKASGLVQTDLTLGEKMKKFSRIFVLSIAFLTPPVCRATDQPTTYSLPGFTSIESYRLAIKPQTEDVIRKSVEGWGSRFEKAQVHPILRKGRNLLIIERPGSSQAYLFFVKPGPVPGTAEYALASVATQILGSNGGNSSILFDELRAKRGLTYHASFQITKRPGSQSIFGVTFGANEKIGELASLHLKEWQKFYDNKNITESDLKEADIAYRAMRDREAGETIGELMQSAAETMSISGDIKPIWNHPLIDKASFNAAKEKWLKPDDFTLLVLGDSTQVKSALEAAIGPISDVQVLPADSDWDDVSKAMLKR